jgi:hypothetical protein
VKNKLLDETFAGDESKGICVPGGAILEIWPSLFGRARRATDPVSKALK